MIASKCTPLNNNSKISEIQSYVTNAKLSSVKFESKEVINIRSLDVNKVHGHDNIFIRILKICDTAIVEPLTIIFDNCINHSMYPDVWKKSNVYIYIYIYILYIYIYILFIKKWQTNYQ